MKILINERLSEHRYKTPEGYLICTDSILARTGKQKYRKNEIFKDSDDETEIEVDRTEDEVFSPQTLASFENKPITVEHPDEDVNVHNYKEYAVGFIRDVRRGDANGQPVMLGNLVITDEQTIQEIENGEHTELSCGYDCDIADEPNPCQRNIRGNHVALCECGRAGIARIVDSTCDANRLPAKVKRDLQKFLNHKSTFISNKDYDIAEFVKEFERVSRLWAEFPLKIVRESIKGWFKTGDGMMRKDYIFSIEGYDDRFMVSIYAKPETYETTELNAYFTDSVKDETKKKAIARYGEPAAVFHHWQVMSNQEAENLAKQMSIKNPRDMYYVIYDDVMNPSSDLYWVKGKSYTDYVKALKMRDSISTRKFDAYELRDIYGRDWDEGLKKEFPNLKVHEFAYFGEVKISGPDTELNKLQKRVKYEDSMKDELIPPTKEAINKFESLLKILNIKIDKKGLTAFGRVHYQVCAIMPFDQFVKILERIDDEMDKLGIPMTFNAGSDGNICTAGIDLDKQHVKDSQRAQKIIKIVKSIK